VEEVYQKQITNTLARKKEEQLKKQNKDKRKTNEHAHQTTQTVKRRMGRGEGELTSRSPR